jgi:hypothetical protein
MKSTDFGDALKIGKCFFFQEFKFPPKFLGYLKAHSWGAPTALTKKCTDFLKSNLACSITDIC